MCQCRSDRRGYTGTAGKETQGEAVVAIPAVSPSVFLAAVPWGWDGERGDLNYCWCQAPAGMGG